MSEPSEDQSSPDQPTPDQPNRGRRQLIIIMTIALISLGGSYLLFFVASQGNGWGTTNHGAFVQPHTTTEQLGWVIHSDDRNWRLWVVAEDDCDNECAGKVKDLRALHILLSAEAGRVRRALTLLQGGSQDVVLPEPFPKLERVDLHTASEIAEVVYIVDPNGNLVLHYEMARNPKHILEDLKKLLKISQIG